MAAFELTPTQAAVSEADGASFLLGPAGTGKTTALQQRLLHLLRGGEPAYTILTLVAEPEQREPYLEAIHRSGLGPYAHLTITTYSRLALEMVALFWPLTARAAGFTHPYRPPTILSYDLAQLLMWYVVTPMLGEGAFAGLRLRPQQLVSQVLDTLNRAALNSLSLETAVARQIQSWSGEPDLLRHLRDAAHAAQTFRRVCLENSLLDLSLVIETFDTQLVGRPEFHRYFSERYRHLIVDNVEEQTPAGQNFISSLMELTQSTAIAYDGGGGYKRFMAADPTGARQFHGRCRRFFQFEELSLAPPQMQQVANLVENYLLHSHKPTAEAGEMVLAVANGRYRREMVHDLIPLLRELVDGGVAPADIAIIAPYLDGALRYTLTEALTAAGLPYRLLRRRSSPREEPRVRAWLTWLALAHPDWGIFPAPYDVAEALTLSIAGLDPARAALLTRQLYRAALPDLLPVDELPAQVVERVGPDLAALVEELRAWLLANGGRFTLDAFLHSLFTDLLSQPRFQPEPDLAGAAVCEWLVASAARLRQAADALGFAGAAELGAAFINGIQQGLVTADPPDLGDPPAPHGITIATIYGYLLAGAPVRVQVWLETAATGWWDIPNQPLSNAFVLAPHYDAQRPWTMQDDFAIRQELLSRIVRGLTSRCMDGVILAHSELDRRGVRQDGPLWRALQPVIQ